MASTRLTRAHTPRVLGLFRLGTRLVRVRADDRASIDTTTYTSQAPLDYNPSLSRVLSTNSVTPLAHTYCALHLRANLPSAKVARHSPSRSPSSNVFIRRLFDEDLTSIHGQLVVAERKEGYEERQRG
jgi:hypothetical protein